MAVWRVRLARRPLLVTLVAVVALTLMFDAVFIALEIYAYNPALTLPVRIINIPVEDFAYAIVAAVFVPYLWESLGKGPREG